MNTISLAILKKSHLYSEAGLLFPLRSSNEASLWSFYYQTRSTRKLKNKIPVVENKPSTVLLFCLSYLLLILFYPHSYKLGNTATIGEITAFSHVACIFLCPCDSSQFPATSTISSPQLQDCGHVVLQMPRDGCGCTFNDVVARVY